MIRKLLLCILVAHSLSAIDRPVCLIVGTRPEAIKMMPVYRALKEINIPVFLCSTGQHRDMLSDIFALFEATPDIEFSIMKPGQDLFYITESVLRHTKQTFEKLRPSLVIVQGDTASAMTAALAAFYLKIPVVHIEAGLRTGNMEAPFPEEMNRRVISLLASLHFAPTPLAVSNLLREGVDKELIYCSGNTVIDTLLVIRGKIDSGELKPSPDLVKTIKAQKEQGRKIVLLTAHRRESLSGGLSQVYSAMNQSLHDHPELFVIYPKHPNPLIIEILEKSGLAEMENILITNPLSYQDMVYLLTEVDGVATDSGGIQEEAVSLNKPVLILREETGRPEGIEEGLAFLAGKEPGKITAGITLMLQSKKRQGDSFVYGDGRAAKRIARVINNHLKGEN